MMTLTTSDIISLAALVAALLALVGYYNRVFLWIQRQGKQDEDLKAVKAEQQILCVGLAACLDGLEQLGANHSVTKAKQKLVEHIQNQAHK